MRQGRIHRSGWRAAVVGWMLPVLLVSSAQGAERVAPYDFDGDGIQEAAWPMGSDSVLIAPVGPDGVPRVVVHTGEEMNLPPNTLTGQAASGDFNGDGDGDLAAVAEWGRTNTHQGLLLLPGGRRVPRPANARLIEDEDQPDDMGWDDLAVIARDVDRDGRSDLIAHFPSQVAYNKTGTAETLILWGGRRHLSFARATVVRSQAPAASYYADRPTVAVGKLDADARREILIGETSGHDDTDDQRPTKGWLAVCDVSRARRIRCDQPFDTPIHTRQPVVGDVMGDGYDDVVLPYAEELVHRDAIAGGLLVYRGTAEGLEWSSCLLTCLIPGQREGPVVVDVTQDTEGIPGTNEPGDAFGFDIAIGNVDGRGKDDLLVGAPGENRRGAVSAIFGHSEGLGQGGGRRVSPATAGIENTKYDEMFGSRVGLRDVMGNGTDDAIVIGDCNEDGGGSTGCSTAERCSAVWLIPTGRQGRLHPGRSTRLGPAASGATADSCVAPAGHDEVPD